MAPTDPLRMKPVAMKFTALPLFGVEDGGMKKVFLSVVALAGAVVLARGLLSRVEGIDWEKRFERMPDNAPPKWMFRNISAIRNNTERILDLLEREPRGTT